MRLIDVDALTSWMIKELRQQPNGVFNGLNGRQAANLIGKAIDEAPTIGGWISVKDRLPEDEYECLVLCEGKWYWIGWFKADKQQWVIDGVICGDGFVTHWMPIPEPPKEDDND